jgi:predicted transcriptional regulator
MTKLTVRTDNTAGFFDRAKDAARRADKGQHFDESIVLSFEDPQDFFNVLTETRLRLMQEIMRKEKTIKELIESLHRNRSSIAKDLSLLEKAGLIVSMKKRSPGHGAMKVVKAIAPKIELVATIN